MKLKDGGVISFIRCTAGARFVYLYADYGNVDFHGDKYLEIELVKNGKHGYHFPDEIIDTVKEVIHRSEILKEGQTMTWHIDEGYKAYEN